MLRSSLAAITVLFFSCASEAVSSSDADDYLALRRTIGREKYDEAIATCIELIRAHPDFLPLYETLPEVAQYAGNMNKAVTFLESRVEDGTALPFVYYGLGTAYYSKRDYRSAVVYFNNAVEAGNTTPECYRGLEYAYEKLEGLEAATRYFNLLCHRDPQNPNNWYGLALAYWTRQDYDRVKSCLCEALARRPGERRYVQAQVAATYLLGETDSVSRMMTRLIAIASEERDFVGKEFLKSFVVIDHFSRDRYQSAIQTIQEIIDDGKTFGYLRWLGWGHKRMSDVKFLMGEYQPAISYAKEAAALAEKVGDEELLLAALTRQFEVYSETGDYYDALETAYQEKIVTQKKEASCECIRPLVDVACALHDLGSDDIALEFAIEALGKCETLKSDSRLPFQIHMCLGLIYEGLESYDESFRHFKVAANQIPADKFSARNAAICHGHLGRSLLNLHRYTDARHHLNKQLWLALHEGYNREVCYAEAYLGMLNFEQGNYSQSRELFERAYEQGIRLGQLPALLICARGLSALSERRGRLSEAILWREKAITSAESMGLWHERIVSLGCSDREVLRDYHEYVRLLCAHQEPERAFEAAEKAKALSLSKLINTPQVLNSLVGSDPDRARLSSLEEEILRLHAILASEKVPVVPANSTTSSLSLISSLNHLEMSFQKTLDTLRGHNSRLYGLLKSTACSSRETQEALLDPEGALIEFVVGERNISVIVLLMNTVATYQVPISQKVLTETMSKISDVFAEGKRRIPIMNAAVADINLEALHEAFKLLLKPAIPLVRTVKHITIVSDGALSNFPFELLVTTFKTEVSAESRLRPHYLLEDFEINYALSASTAIRERHCTHHAAKPLFAIGDAIPRTTNRRRTGLLREHAGEWDLPDYQHVYPGVRRELAAIKRIFGQRADVVSQTDATASTFTEQASNYRILHIAAHVNFDDSRPLYSLIVLSPNARQSQNNGIRAIDFLSMELNAELVVLSGCNTGRVSSGSSVPAMTSALILSGVPSVVASLWNVDDEVTAQLMEAFYSELDAGRGKGESLRLAKLQLIRSGKSDPFYWGAFVLCGDGGKVYLEDERQISFTIPANGYAIAGVAFVGIMMAIVCAMRGRLMSRYL